MKLNLQNEFKIKYSAVIPLSICEIQKPHLLRRHGIDAEGSLLLFLVPYYTENAIGGNISCYAAGRDYHAVFSDISSAIKNRLTELLPYEEFVSFADHAPINEKLAAAKAGLGVIGMHSLLINPEYASFVFIGGIYSNIAVGNWFSILDGVSVATDFKIKHCDGCGICRASCPASCISKEYGIDPMLCLSGITQKKSLTEKEADAVRKAPFIWGCDVCQLSCPMTKSAIRKGTIETPLSEFKEDLIPYLDEKTLDLLIQNGEFARRAFSWRGPEVLYRNLKLQEKDTEK